MTNTLFIDFGNSFVKFALVAFDKYASKAIDINHIKFEAQRIQDFYKNITTFNPLLNNGDCIHQISNNITSKGLPLESIQYVLISSVRSKVFNDQVSLQIEQQLNLKLRQIYFLKPHDKFDFNSAYENNKSVKLINMYENKHLLGTDRWLVVIAASYLDYIRVNKNITDVYKNRRKGVIVISAGTAITIEYIEMDKDIFVYQGGIIMPGLYKMLDSLYKTDNLPLIKFNKTITDKVVATNTEDAIKLGVQSAIIGAVERNIAHINKVCLKSGENNADLINVYITGGDANYINHNINYKSELNEYLLFLGMYLEFNNILFSSEL